MKDVLSGAFSAWGFAPTGLPSRLLECCVTLQSISRHKAPKGGCEQDLDVRFLFALFDQRGFSLH